MNAEIIPLAVMELVISVFPQTDQKSGVPLENQLEVKLFLLPFSFWLHEAGSFYFHNPFKNNVTTISSEHTRHVLLVSIVKVVGGEAHTFLKQ